MNEYLLGGNTIKTIPVALSLIASTISPITLLSTPPYVYLHGIHHLLVIISMSIASILVVCLYLPVIVTLETPNAFEYLKLRFNKHVQTFASGIFILQIILLNPSMAFIPAAAFSKGLNVHLISSIVCIICIFYTTVGGFKAVIWTDVVQFGGILISTIVVLCLVIMSADDFKTVWLKSREGQRIDINFTLDPTTKESFWSITFGTIVLWMYLFSVHPACVQKYLSISDRKQAKSACIIFSAAVCCITTLYIGIGFVLYAIYRGCDPLSTGRINHTDQLLPYFIVDVADDIYLVKGVFMVGIFSAALSTLSSSFNCLGATIYGDFVKPYINRNTSENYVIKLIVTACGTLCLILSLVIDKVGILLLLQQLPKVPYQGAMWGIVSSFVISLCIAIGHEWYKLKGSLSYGIKPLSVENCTYDFNFTAPMSVTDTNKPFFIFRISIWYYSLICASLVIIIGLIVSWCTKADEKNVDPKLISPAINNLINKCKSNKNDVNIHNNVEIITYTFNKN
ncbi:hypothetical protein FQR65_LT12732 [Abscondita terminalis]|nr:hypothetical protein FQR65_LT12732 [Abscondita terminalis]